MVAGPLRGDCGRAPRSVTKGRTAAARGGSGLSPGNMGDTTWEEGLGGTEIRCWICWEADLEVGGERCQARVAGAERGRELVEQMVGWWPALGYVP